MELSLRFGQGDVAEAMRLMQHIESRHIKEPGVAESLTRLLINAGLLNPDGTPAAMPAGPRGGEAVAAPRALETLDARRRIGRRRRQTLDAGRVKNPFTS